MPIVFVHGVRVRSDGAFREVEPQLRRYVAPRLNPADPKAVKIVHCFWGDVGVEWAWDKASRPKSSILSQGAGVQAVSPLDLAAGAAAPTALATPMGGGGNLLGMGPGGAGVATVELKDLSSEELADTVIAFLEAAAVRPDEAAEPGSAEAVDGYVTLAALEVCSDGAGVAALAAQPPADQMKVLADRTLVRAGQLRAADQVGLVAAGPSDWAERAGEFFKRAVSAPGFLASRLLGELRPLIHEFVADFLGDVLIYQTRRGTPGAPGPIVQRLLDALAAARTPERPNEKLVVLTHSMGGQVAYDVFTAFAPAAARPDVAFWASAGAQVAFFEEAKLFHASDPSVRKNAAPPKDRQPVPDCVQAWWNVWDVNDFVAFTAKDIFVSSARFQPGKNAAMVDESYVNGAGLALAHVSYFKRPSFWRRFEDRLSEAGI
ncbi:MAG: hypothetical protein ACK41C_14500 [Phenylobacterium sp.]|uniref:hypothetical protein n=1 Tax=Phenylobacterium sp. TaxID=1871053 RepID=UPI00391DCB20